jgi:hypothetical protein
LLRKDRVWGLKLRYLKKTLDISDFKGPDPVSFPDGRKKHGFGGVLEQFEEFIGDLQGVVAFLFCLVQEPMKSGVHLVHQLEDPLRFKLRSHPQKHFPMGRVFDLFLSIETPSMESDTIPFEHHFEMVRIGEDLTRPFGIGRRDGITIGLKLDKAGFADGGQDDPIRAIGNGWKGHELLFF